VDDVKSSYLIGLDYGTESARGVLIDATSGEQVSSHSVAYRHGVMTQALPNGIALPLNWALQNAADFLEAAEEILTQLGRGRTVDAMGIGFTASSPLPATESGCPLSDLDPGEPHAYVKLWKHGSAQPYAERINRTGGAFLRNFGGKLSGEWLIAKAAQIAAEAPDVWTKTSRFIEAGDWLVWQLTGVECRSLGFAAYKAQYDKGVGYPAGVVPGLVERLSDPHAVGAAAGCLTESWRARTGIKGRAVVAVAVIDSHVVLPAVGAAAAGCLVGALGTSAVYLFLSEQFHPLPHGIEGVAKDGSIRGLWCYEAGQAGFGDTLAWFVKTFPLMQEPGENFRAYNIEAAKLNPANTRPIALDWWNGNRVPLADATLSGLLLGLTTSTTRFEIYRALMESLCFGARTIVELFEAGGLAIDRVVLTSGLALNNPVLIQIMADVLDRPVDVPQMAHATATGAGIHGAVAAGLVPSFQEGARRFGATNVITYTPAPENVDAYDALYQQYRALADDQTIRRVMNQRGTGAASTTQESA
jgi:L-ribulokinase